jgi:hypothetical protein
MTQNEYKGMFTLSNVSLSAGRSSIRDKLSGGGGGSGAGRKVLQRQIKAWATEEEEEEASAEMLQKKEEGRKRGKAFFAEQ